MTTSPSNPARQAREALGARLRELRLNAGLTGRALAVQLGWHYTKVSRIEHGGQTPPEAEIRAWCAACHADEQVPDLVASMRAVDSMYREWRRQTREGMKRLLLSSVPLYERTRLFRIYEKDIVPGLFQTADYVRAVLEYFVDFLGAPDDIDASVEARVEQQRVLYRGDRRFMVVVEESALHTRVGSTETMAGQLDRLLAVMSLPRVSLGIIPAASPHTVFTSVGFWIYDDAMVGIEIPSASLEVTQPRELGLYVKMFEQLQAAAVYGRNARELIGRALADLDPDAA